MSLNMYTREHTDDWTAGRIAALRAIAMASSAFLAITSISATDAREITSAAYALVGLLVANARHLDLPWLTVNPTPATFLDALIADYKALS